MIRLIYALIIAIFLAGCAGPSLYQWGSYEQMLYQSYKDPAKTEALRSELESHIGLVEKSGQRVAPGLYAELGTLYLQAGNKGRAIALYRRERETWPESNGLMSAMIQNLEKAPKKSGEESK
jgi:hypothetical protein